MEGEEGPSTRSASFLGLRAEPPFRCASWASSASRSMDVALVESDVTRKERERDAIVELEDGGVVLRWGAAGLVIRLMGAGGGLVVSRRLERRRGSDVDLGAMMELGLVLVI